MKRILLLLLALLVVIPAAHAQDENKRKAKKQQKKEQAQTTGKKKNSSVTTTKKEKAANNPYFHKQNTNPGAMGNYTKVKYKNNGTVKVKKNGTVVVKNKYYKPRRKFVVVGNGVTFVDAKRYNWHQRHERAWWDSQGYRFIQYGGGYWFWNNGWWYPAYGYSPSYSRYAYDGPIYGYGYTNPNDVVSEVQRALAAYGYYRGPVDGMLGPGTRAAIQEFQVDNGLEVTSAVDQQTLVTLGLT